MAIPAIGETHHAALSYRTTPGAAAPTPGRTGGRGCTQLGTSESPKKWRLWAEPFSGGEEGMRRPALGTKPMKPAGTSAGLLIALILALCSATTSSFRRSPRSRAPLVAPRPPPPARGPAQRAPSQAQVIKARLRQPDCGPEMRPKELGQGCAGDRDGPGPGDPPAVTAAPPSAASPAPGPSAAPEPAPARTAAPRAGSRSPSVSGPPAGARRASEAASEPRAQRASAFSAVRGRAQPGPSKSDAPRTHFILQGHFGARAIGLATGEAAGTRKTPAAHFGQRPGVSGRERAAFIRELQGGKPGPGTPEPVAPGQLPAPRRLPHPRDVAVCRARPAPSSLPPPLLAEFRRGSRPARSRPAPHACCCSRSAHSPCPAPRPAAVPGEGRGAAGGAAGRGLSLRWTAAPAAGRWVGSGRSSEAGSPPRRLAESASSPPSYPPLSRGRSLDWGWTRGSGGPSPARDRLLPSSLRAPQVRGG